MLTRYYPIAGNDKGSHADTAASWSDTRRPIDRARGEVGEWLLVDGVRIFGLQTPSTCTNIGIFAAHALLGEDERIDLVISGPNLGRNTGSAFCVSSGTVGAALSGALCGCKGISISFGHFVTAPPSLLPGRTEPLTPDEQTLARKRALAHSVSLVQQLWNKWDQNTQVYTINVPLCDTLEVPEVRWTRIWQSKHGPSGSYLDFAPDLSTALRPASDAELEPDTDVWAVCTGRISVSPLLTTFAQPHLPTTQLSVTNL